MKDINGLLGRQYSAVKFEDDQQHNQSAAAKSTGRLTLSANAAKLLQHATFAEKQRQKSLNPNRSMNTAGLLSSFFNESRSDKCGRSPKCAFLVLAIGVLCITSAVLVKIFRPYDAIFNWKLNMEGGGEIFNLWAEPPVDLYIKIYLFNITNAEAFLAGREKMKVEQVGPYVYKELMTHENIEFNANHTMSTNPSHPLVWQEHLSEGHKEDDEVVMLNIAMLAIAHLTTNKPYFVRLALNTLLATSNSNPIVRMTAKEFMFGYESSLTTLGNTFLPSWISFEKVGLIDRMYDFSTDFETFYTGETNRNIAGLYATYRGDANLEQWEGEHCSNIELASDGTKFKSKLQPNETVKFFRKSMCRPVNLHREGELEKYGSLSGYKYVFEENALDNGEINEKNKCFCRNGKCQPRGLIDVTDCYYGFPISLSYPHFMDGDEKLVNQIEGMVPNKEVHKSAFVIQPDSGLPLSLSAKIQINMHFNNLSPFKRVAQFSHLTVPMLWFDITMPKLSDSLDMRFNFYLNLLPYIDVIGFWGGLAVGTTLLIFAVTRATMRMSSLTQAAHNISDGKYAKANLLRAAAGNSVYNPCEMKLIHTNEKQTLQEPSRKDEASAIEKTANFIYREVERRPSVFALEIEPALSNSDSSDEGNDSDCPTVSLSRNSTASSAMDSQSESNFLQNSQASNDNPTSDSFESGGIASSITGSHDDSKFLLDEVDSESSGSAPTTADAGTNTNTNHIFEV